MDKLLSTAIGLLTIAGVLVGAIFWFACFLRAASPKFRRRSWLEGARIDRIEESRSIGMQRLAKTEEAVGSMQESRPCSDSMRK